MITRLFALLFAASVAVSAQTSQPPSQRLGPTGRQVQSRPTNQDGESSANQTPERTAESTAIKPISDDNQSTPNQTTAEHEEATPLLNFLEGVDPNWIIALLTLALFVLAFCEYLVNRNTVALVKSVERAYVHMTHERPGLNAHGGGRFKIVNTGNTPATVTDVYSHIALVNAMDSVPERPNYSLPMPPSHVGGTRAFLMKDGHLYVPFEANDVEFAEARANNQKVLFVYGYVDYVDKFSTRHRTGYGRFYMASLDIRESYGTPEDFAGRSNLAFLPKATYNYNRERLRGEGIDWKEDL